MNKEITFKEFCETFPNISLQSVDGKHSEAYLNYNLLTRVLRLIRMAECDAPDFLREKEFELIEQRIETIRELRTE